MEIPLEYQAVWQVPAVLGMPWHQVLSNGQSLDRSGRSILDTSSRNPGKDAACPKGALGCDEIQLLSWALPVSIASRGTVSII